jgi:hypothetical protein
MQNSSHKNPHSPRNPGTKLLHHKYPKNLISSHPSALLVILLVPVVVVLLLLLELLKNNILTHSLTYQSGTKTFPQRRPQYTNSFTLKKTKLRFTLVTTQLINSLALATICPTTHIQKRDGERNQSIEKRFAIAELELQLQNSKP